MGSLGNGRTDHGGDLSANPLGSCPKCAFGEFIDRSQELPGLCTISGWRSKEQVPQYPSPVAQSDQCDSDSESDGVWMTDVLRGSASLFRSGLVIKEAVWISTLITSLSISRMGSKPSKTPSRSPRW